jgi:hypothetical protein
VSLVWHALGQLLAVHSYDNQMSCDISFIQPRMILCLVQGASNVPLLVTKRVRQIIRTLLEKEGLEIKCFLGVIGLRACVRDFC